MVFRLPKCGPIIFFPSAGADFAIVDEHTFRIFKNGESGLLLYTNNSGIIKTVCSAGFDDNYARAICREMGYPDFSTWTKGALYDVQTSYSDGLTDIDCSSAVWADCTWTEDDGDGSYTSCGTDENVHLACQGEGSTPYSILNLSSDALTKLLDESAAAAAAASDPDPYPIEFTCTTGVAGVELSDSQSLTIRNPGILFLWCIVETL